MEEFQPQSPTSVATDAAYDEENEPPDDLICPITYALFRDPVRCLSDGRIYERCGIIGFWQRRPLADFLGGPRLSAARLEPALCARERVCEWLDAHPDVVPAGWPSRDRGPLCDMELCNMLSAQVDRAAAARAAAEAAEAGGGAALDAALDALRGFSHTVRLVGRTPGGRRGEFLGVYERCDELPLVAGRYCYRQRGGAAYGPRTRMLWYAANGFWHAGWQGNLGQQTGWLIVGDAAPAPEHIVSTWQLWDGGKLWQAPRVRCVADVEGASDEEVLRLAGDDLFLAGRADEPTDDEAAEAAAATEEAHEMAQAFAHAAATVHLYAAAPEFWFSKPELLGWLGSYDREHLLGGDVPTRVNGRFCYAMRRAPERMLWWANGYWHAGLRSSVGEQTALLIAGDAAAVPERVVSPWMWYENGAWVPSACLVHCAAGPAPPARGQACVVSAQLAGLGAIVAVAVALLDRPWPTFGLCLMAMCSLPFGLLSLFEAVSRPRTTWQRGLARLWGGQ